METPENIPVVKNPNICLCLPVYGKADVPFFQCLMATLSGTRNLIDHIDFLVGDSLVNRARNVLSHRFLEGYIGQNEKGEPVRVLHEWMLFLDTDLMFNPQSVVSLLELGRARGPGIYAGCYPIKQLKPKIVMNNLPGHLPGPDGTVEVREAGTGFMLIHREVFEQMREKYRDEIEYFVDNGDAKNTKLGWDFFSVGVRFDKDLGRKRFLSEDWYFCQRWREMGGHIILQTKIQCQHIGTIAYPPPPDEIIEAAKVIQEAKDRMAKMGATKTISVTTVTDDPPKSETVQEVAVAVMD